MPVAPQLAQRALNYGLDDRARARLCALGPILVDQIGLAIQDTHASCLKLPHVAAVWRDHGQELERLEQQHLRELLTAEFDASYLQSCKQTVIEELALGFETRARMALSSALISRSEAALKAMHWFGHGNSVAILSRALLFDLATTTSFYLEELDLASKKRATTIEAAIEGFGEAINGVFVAIRQNNNALSKATESIRIATTKAVQIASTAAISSDIVTDSVRSTAQATQELASTANEIGTRVAGGLGVTKSAVEAAERTSISIDTLNAAAKQISSVVDVISAFAAQTNLLALNATIEAARAGQSGKGFGVVAAEVKLLADQTSKAIGTISNQVAAIQNASQVVTADISELREAISRVRDLAGTIATAVEEQSATTSAISTNLETAASSTTETSAHVATMLNSVSQCSGVADEIVRWTEQLTTSASDFQNRIEQFFSKVRAA